MSSASRCGCSDTDQHDTLKRTEKLVHQYRSADTGQTLYVNVRYTVVYSSTKTNISLAQIREQHRTLNECYAGQNASQSKIPRNGKYAFWDSVGVPSVQFLPVNELNLTDSQITRVKCDQTFKSLDEMKQFLQLQNISQSPTCINIISAPLITILGQSVVSGNLTMVDSGAFGSELLPGFLLDFGMGMTLVHEMGHVLGLTHTWNNTKSTPVLSDVPPQKYPNYTFKLISNADSGEPDAFMCNRMRDCQIASGNKEFILKNKQQPYSWLSPNNCSSTLFEMGCNFMDYASDANMAMFTKQQSSIIRASVLSNTFSGESQRLAILSSLKASNLWWRSVEAVVCGSVIGLGILVATMAVTIPVFQPFRWIILGIGIGLILLSAVTFGLLFKFNRKPSTPGVAPKQLRSMRTTSISTRSATITWDSNEFNKSTSYTVDMDGKQYVTESPSITLTDLSPANTYIVAVSSGNPSTTKRLTLITAPDAPKIVTASNISNTSLTLSWESTNGTARTTYNVHQDQVLVNNLESTSINLTDLVPGREYTFGVSCQTVSGESTQTLTVCTMIPMEVSSIHLKNSDSNSMAISYTVPSTGYYSKFNVYLNGVFAQTVMPAQTSYIVYNLAPETAYDVKMTTVSNDVESPGVSATCSTFMNVPAITNLSVNVATVLVNFRNYTFTFSTALQDGSYTYSWVVHTDDASALQQKGVLTPEMGTISASFEILGTFYWITSESTQLFCSIRTIKKNSFGISVPSESVSISTSDLPH